MLENIGCDIVSIKSISKVLTKYPDKFPQRILGESELSVYSKYSDVNAVFYIAKRFAAKEAVSKALGTGIAKELSFKSIEILNDSNGKPFVLINNRLCSDILVSISDEKEYAIAFVVKQSVLLHK